MHAAAICGSASHSVSSSTKAWAWASEIDRATRSSLVTTSVSPARTEASASRPSSSARTRPGDPSSPKCCRKRPATATKLERVYWNIGAPVATAPRAGRQCVAVDDGQRTRRLACAIAKSTTAMQKSSSSRDRPTQRRWNSGPASRSNPVAGSVPGGRSPRSTARCTTSVTTRCRAVARPGAPRGTRRPAPPPPVVTRAARSPAVDSLRGIRLAATALAASIVLVVTGGVREDEQRARTVERLDAEDPEDPGPRSTRTKRCSGTSARSNNLRRPATSQGNFMWITNALRLLREDYERGL